MDIKAVFSFRKKVQPISDEKSSLKVIRVACDPDEVKQLHNDDQIANIYKERLKDIASVCLDNKKIKSNNVVRYEDIKYRQHQDGIGCDILIKTEPVVPLSEVAKEHCSEKQIIKLAKDICMALIACEKQGLVHGNIDFSNIYVSEYGRYKLGHVGIERVFDQYRANGVYDNCSDIFSLGCVMLNLCQKHNSVSDASESAHVSDRLSGIINKACSTEPDERYQSAREMLDDLKALSGRIRIAWRSIKRAIKGVGIVAAFVLPVLISYSVFRNYDSWRSGLSDHVHVYSNLNSDPKKHWRECECGDSINDLFHNYSLNNDDDYHWKACVCGRINGYETHNYATWDIVTVPTEICEGLKESYCEICNNYTSVSIEMIEHTHKYSDDWYGDDLSHWKKCTVCGEKSIEGSHTLTQWPGIEDATITSAGKWKITCEDCGYAQEEDIPEHDHISTGVKYNGSNHWEECICGVKYGVAAHSQNGKLKFDKTSHWKKCVCGYKYDVVAHSYKENDWTVTVAATITSTGKRERSCDDCEYVAEEVIQKLSHEQHINTGIWVSDETHHWNECSVCHQKLNYAAHTYEWSRNYMIHWEKCECGQQRNRANHSFPDESEWKVVKEATETSEGKKIGICIDCEYLEEKTIPMLLKIDSIIIASMPEKTEYVVGEQVNLDGLSLKVTYVNGQTEIITSGFEYSPTSFNSTGVKIVTVIYRGNTLTFMVKVTK